MRQLFCNRRMSQLLCALLLLTSCYTTLGQERRQPPSITLFEPTQLQVENFISLTFQWELFFPNQRNSEIDIEIECTADINGQEDRHEREGSISITIERLQGNQIYRCCIEAEIEERNLTLRNCTLPITTNSVTVISSTAAIAMIAVAVVLFVASLVMGVVLCIVLYRRIPKATSFSPAKYEVTNTGGLAYISHVTQRPLPHPHRFSGAYETIPDPPYEHIGQHGNQNVTVDNRTACTSENKDNHSYHTLEKTVSEKEQSQEENDRKTPPTNTEATPTTDSPYHVLESVHNEPQDTTQQSVEYNNSTPQDYEVPSSSQENITEL